MGDVVEDVAGDVAEERAGLLASEGEYGGGRYGMAVRPLCIGTSRVARNHLPHVARRVSAARSGPLLSR